MATIIENGTPAPSRNVYMTGEDASGSAWAVVVLVLVVAVIAGAIWYTRYYHAAAPSSPGTVQVNLPGSSNPPASSQSSASSNTTSDGTNSSGSTGSTGTGSTGSASGATTQTTPGQ